MKMITSEMVEELNVECPYSGFRFAYLPQNSCVEIVLRNTDGIESYIINITNDSRVWIEEYFHKKFGIKLMWNNVANIFWSIGE